MKRAEDILHGACSAVCAGLFSTVAFGGQIGLSAAAAILSLTGCILLLQTACGTSRKRRSVTAAVLFLPVLFGMFRLNVYGTVFAAINPAYVREFGGPSIGDIAGLFFVYIPVSLLILLSAAAAASLRTKLKNERKSS